MIEVRIPESEAFDARTNEFISLKAYTLSLEHSLVSISKWESTWKKPFLHTKNKTNVEMLDYIRCMTITQNIPDEAYYRIPESEFERVAKYIEDPMTATTFSNQENKPRKREIVTAEVIYFWMIQANVPFECRKWHLNQLLTLLQVCAEKSQPPKKRSKNAIAKQWSALNAARRAKLHTNG